MLHALIPRTNNIQSSSVRRPWRPDLRKRHRAPCGQTSPAWLRLLGYRRIPAPLPAEDGSGRTGAELARPGWCRPRRRRYVDSVQGRGEVGNHALQRAAIWVVVAATETSAIVGQRGVCSATISRAGSRSWGRRRARSWWGSVRQALGPWSGLSFEVRAPVALDDVGREIQPNR